MSFGEEHRMQPSIVGRKLELSQERRETVRLTIRHAARENERAVGVVTKRYPQSVRFQTEELTRYIRLDDILLVESE